MEIRINGKVAALKTGSSFDYIIENRSFTGSDGYSMTISFPLRGCPQNTEIFGHINRTDVLLRKIRFDCDIRDREFFKSGTLTITELTDVEVKCQFLEGRSEQNFDDTFDDVYINDLELGYATKEEQVASGNAADKWIPWTAGGPGYVALPWVNNTSGNIQNAALYNSETHIFEWQGNTRGLSTSLDGAASVIKPNLSFQPYLIYLTKKICEVMGYSYDFSAWESNDCPYAVLLMCNTLPSAWDMPNFARALPRWTITEYFEELEKLMGAEFDIDHKARKVTISFTNDVIKSAPVVKIDKVVDEYAAEVTTEDNTNYVGTANIRYADCDHEMWPFYSCEWFIKKYGKYAKSFDRYYDLLEYAKNFATSGVYPRHTTVNNREYYANYLCRGYDAEHTGGNELFYAKDVDTYFLMYCYQAKYFKSTERTYYEREGDRNSGGSLVEKTKKYNWYNYKLMLMPINQFGAHTMSEDKDASNEIELRCVPVWIDDTDDTYGLMMFLECGTTDEPGIEDAGYSSSGGLSSTYDADFPNRGGTRPSGGSAVFVTSDKTDDDYNEGARRHGAAAHCLLAGKSEERDAYFDKIYVGYWSGTFYSDRSQKPELDRIIPDKKFREIHFAFNLRLTERKTVAPPVDPKQKYKFSFLSDTIPNARAIYIINGLRYICSKLTTTFTAEAGRSQLIKGEFYRMEAPLS